MWIFVFSIIGMKLASEINFTRKPILLELQRIDFACTPINETYLFFASASE